MDLIQALILAIIQGIAEWLPISSSGHLAIFQIFMKIPENISYDVILHLSTVFIITIFFWKDISAILKKPKYILYLIIATIPIGIVGFLIKDYIDVFFSSLLYIGLSMIFTSLILWFTDKASKGKINIKNSIIIGLFQAIAILPGVSRSGSTISGGIISGVKREEAIRFSFILAIPAILGATLLNLKDISLDINSNMIIGFIACSIISFFVLKYFIGLVRKNKLKYFSYYCFFVGLALVVYHILF